jgi:tRNA U38,U39,U40 pseudouridine synthase TruA
MVRRVVGVLAAVGRREIPPAAAMAVEKATAAALAAPAAGLFLEAVRYQGDPPLDAVRPVLVIPSS